MFNQLSDRFQAIIKQMRGESRLSEQNVADAVRQVRIALLEADVHFQVVKQFTQRVKEKALGQEVFRSVNPGQLMVKIFHDELVKILGADSQPKLDLARPGHILIVGLNGAGKTTSSGKLAMWLVKQGRRPVLVPCDLRRPAAIEQLKTLGRQTNVLVFDPSPGENNMVRVARSARDWAQDQSADVLIFDTAGRQEVDSNLMDELKALHEFARPREVLLVVDAATGQQAVSVAETFHQRLGITGLILTKLDGDARGGAALSMREVTGCPIKFAGTGEKLDQFEPFHGDRLAGRILGMGDVVSLVEKAAEAVALEDAQRMEQRLRHAEFDFNDFLSQMRMLKNMGPLENLLGMMPGMNKLAGPTAAHEKQLKRTEAIVLSMTPDERKRPGILNAKRRQRIARGSGTTVTEVNTLLQQFNQMKKMMKNTGKFKRMLAQAAGGRGLPGMPGGLVGKGFPLP